MKRHTTVVLIMLLTINLALAFGCASKVKTSANSPPPAPAVAVDDVLRGAKTFGSTLAITLDQAVTLEKELADNGTIDKEVEPKIRQGLHDAKVTVAAFNVRAASYDHLDTTSKEDIARLLNDTVTFIDELNRNGVLRIKNPRSQIIVSSLLAGASVAVAIFRSTFDKLQ